MTLSYSCSRAIDIQEVESIVQLIQDTKVATVVVCLLPCAVLCLGSGLGKGSGGPRSLRLTLQLLVKQLAVFLVQTLCLFTSTATTCIH